jgi:glycosyltransferase involved in cell wall biosynthesis
MYLKANFKIAVVLHSNYSMSLVKRMHALSWFFLKRVLRLLKRADVVAGVSKGVLDDAAALGIIDLNKSCVLYNPVVDGTFHAKTRLTVSHKWFLRKKTPLVLTAGRLCQSKRYDILIRAFAWIAEETAARLLIFGDEDQQGCRDSLLSLAKSLSLEDKISLPGATDTLYAYMTQADVFVLSSEYEGLPTVLIEALACGLTPVSTRCPSGPEEILENGKYGYLVPVNNVEALAEGMLAALRHPLDKETLKKRAEFFSAEACYSRYKDMFDKFF